VRRNGERLGDTIEHSRLAVANMNAGGYAAKLERGQI
jgi:hypothetical protein